MIISLKAIVEMVKSAADEINAEYDVHLDSHGYVLFTMALEVNGEELKCLHGWDIDFKKCGLDLCGTIERDINHEKSRLIKRRDEITMGNK